MHSTTVVGLDVHKETIVAALLPAGLQRVTATTKFANSAAELERFANRVTAAGPAEFVYEAGPCGYEVHRQLTALGHRCVIIAPGLTPQRPGDKVKTDRRDAEKLAQLHRAGQLTEVRVPTREQESARDLTRVREDALVDRLRARHRLSKFLLRQGRVWRETKAWGVRHHEWLNQQSFDFEPLRQTFAAYLRALEEAEERLSELDKQVIETAGREPYLRLVQCLRALKGVDTLSAFTLAVEAQDFRRFHGATGFMAYTGLVGREHSSSEKIRRGAITKVGNAHIRRILVESAWNYTVSDRTGPTLETRRKGCAPEVLAIARKAQARLTRKFRKLVGRGKPRQVAVIAIARELAGFVWAIGRSDQAVGG